MCFERTRRVNCCIACMRILLAEDVEDTRYLMKLLLEMRGHFVLEARDGQQAVDCAMREHPDLILMDLSMPVMDGLTATRAIRQNADTASIPIVALSAHVGNDSAMHDEAMRSGCTRCCAKPIDFEAFDELLSIPSSFRPH